MTVWCLSTSGNIVLYLSVHISTAYPSPHLFCIVRDHAQLFFNNYPPVLPSDQCCMPYEASPFLDWSTQTFQISVPLQLDMAMWPMVCNKKGVLFLGWSTEKPTWDLQDDKELTYSKWCSYKMVEPLLPRVSSWLCGAELPANLGGTSNRS